MKTIQFTIDDRYSQIILSMLTGLKNGIIKDLSVRQNTQSHHEKNATTDIFQKTSGILADQKIDPVQWQRDIRAEWDR